MDKYYKMHKGKKVLVTECGYYADKDPRSATLYVKIEGINNNKCLPLGSIKLDELPSTCKKFKVGDRIYRHLEDGCIEHAVIKNMYDEEYYGERRITLAEIKNEKGLSYSAMQINEWYKSII